MILLQCSKLHESRIQSCLSLSKTFTSDNNSFEFVLHFLMFYIYGTAIGLHGVNFPSNSANCPCVTSVIDKDEVENAATFLFLNVCQFVAVNNLCTSFCLRSVLCQWAGAPVSNEDGPVSGVGGPCEFSVGSAGPWHSVEACRP